MKKVLILGLLLLFVISYSGICLAAQGTTPTVANEKKSTLQDSRLKIGNKAERGVNNVVFGWTEIPKKVVDITKESKNPFWGLIAGVYQGTCKAFARTASGAVDVVTCGIKPDEKPFVQPDMQVVK